MTTRAAHALAAAVLVIVLTGLTPLARQAAGSLVIRGVTLVDGTGRAPLANATVVVEAGRITQVTSQAVTPPAGAQIIDGKGKFLMPGLIDVHVHLRGGGNRASEQPITPEQERNGVRALHTFLYAGVTTVFDAGNQGAFIFALREKARTGAILSPRILATGGTVTSPGGHGGPFYVEAWPQDRAVLDKHLAGKPDLVKIGQDEHGWGTRPLITQLQEALLEQIIRYYHSKGIRSTIHISNEHNAVEAIYAGVDTLAHPVIQSPISTSFINLMRTKRVPMASTLTIGESYSRLAEHPEYLDQPLYRDTTDAAEIQRLKTVESPRQREDRWAQWMKVMTPVAQDNLKRLNAAGRDIVALGTDRSSGADVHRELELLVGGGITPADAIVIATRNSARFLGLLDEIGTIEIGKAADLVLLDADPTADINNAKRIATVVRGGAIVDRAALDLPVNAGRSKNRPLH
jgi:imidazolonepropionase-like amidohydrolase